MWEFPSQSYAKSEEAKFAEKSYLILYSHRLICNKNNNFNEYKCISIPKAFKAAMNLSFIDFIYCLSIFMIFSERRMRQKNLFHFHFPPLLLRGSRKKTQSFHALKNDLVTRLIDLDIYFLCV